MAIAIEVYPVMPTRPCSFCLCLQGGSVFADFDTDDASLVSLRRISFDGFGCCEPKEPTRKMDPEASRSLLNAIDSGGLEDLLIQDILRKYFRENADVIWSDALTEHELL